MSEKVITKEINVMNTVEKLLKNGETVDSLAAKTWEFVSNVESLFTSIQNLYNDVGGEILGIGGVSVVCNLCIGGSPVAGVGLGSAQNLAFCANNICERVNNSIKSAPQEKSEP